MGKAYFSDSEWTRKCALKTSDTFTRLLQTFQVSVYDTEGNILGTEALAEQLREFVIPNSRTRNPNPVNLVSSDERDTWAAVYQRLESKMKLNFSAIICPPF